MLYVTGDTHGQFNRFSTKNFPEQRTLTKQDFVLICGDFGGLWNGSREEAYWLDWLESKPFSTLFIAGNHENYDMLDRLPTELWNGGLIQRIRPSVIHLCNGSVFQLDGKLVFVMGGAESHDMPDGILRPGPDLKQQRRILDRRRARYRVEGESWWSQEMPRQEDYQTALTALEQERWIVDLVVTHCLPTSFQQQIDPEYAANKLTDFLEDVHSRLIFRQWYAGHYHQEREWHNERLQLLYERILPTP